MLSFCDTFDLTSLIKEPTCYKNPDNLSCIDLTLTNKLPSFQNSFVVEIGPSGWYLESQKWHFKNWNLALQTIGITNILTMKGLAMIYCLKDQIHT